MKKITCLIFNIFASITLFADNSTIDNPIKTDKFEIVAGIFHEVKPSYYESTHAQITALFDFDKRNIDNTGLDTDVFIYKKHILDGKMLISKGNEQIKNGNRLKDLEDYTIKEIGLNADRRRVSQSEARAKGYKLLEDGENNVEEGRFIIEKINELAEAKKKFVLTRKWKSADGKSVFGSILALYDGNLVFMNQKKTFYILKKSLLCNADQEYIDKFIVAVDSENLKYIKTVPAKYMEALERVKEAYKAGNSYGMYGMGIAYLNGYGVDRNTELAEKCLLDAIKNGVVEASTVLGDYYKSIGSKKQYNIEIYLDAAQKGSRTAMVRLAAIYLKNKNYSDALKWAKSAYAFGYEDVAGNEIYSTSIILDAIRGDEDGVNVNTLRRNLAFRGNLWAIEQETNSTDGTDATKEEVSLFLKGAKMEYPRSLGQLGVVYCAGENYNEARECFDKCLKYSSSNAGYLGKVYLLVGAMLADGIAYRQDLDYAIIMLQKTEGTGYEAAAQRIIKNIEKKKMEIAARLGGY